MTRKQLERIVREWQKRLGLHTWDIEVDFREPAAEEAHASTWRSNVYERAGIRFDREWPRWEPRFANQVVVHELVHLMARDVEESFKPAEPSPEVSRLQDRAIEQLVDRLACRFVDLGGMV